jgi:hypothetical protein
MPVSCGNRRPGRSLTAKVTAKWLRASYAESKFGADQFVANDHEPAVHVLDQDELLAANDHSATTVSLTYLHAERVALLEALDGHELMLDSAEVARRSGAHTIHEDLMNVADQGERHHP